MFSDKTREQLSRLSEREREVLRLRCAQFDYRAIGEKLILGEATVKTHMGRIYIKLGLDQLRPKVRWKMLDAVFCPALKELELPSPPPEPKNLALVPAAILAMVEEDERALVTVPAQVVVISPESDNGVIDGKFRTAGQGKRPSRLRWLVTGLILGILLTGGLDFAFGAALRGTPESLITSTPIVIVAKETVVVTTTPGPLPATAKPEVVVVTATFLPLTATPLSPTNTRLPTFTPTPSVALPFQDNFDQGLSPLWRVINGEPIVLNGRLGAASDTAELEIGDGSWGDFVVELDFYDYPAPISLVFGQKVQYSAYFWPSASSNVWQAFQDNRLVSILPEGRGISADAGHLRVVVIGNTYSVYVNGRLHETITYGSPASGPLGLILNRDHGYVDNLLITAP